MNAFAATGWPAGVLPAAWQAAVTARWPDWVSAGRNADLPRWQAAIAALPAVRPSRIDLQQDCVTIGAATDLDAEQHALLEPALRALHPWRKGPFDFFGTRIDTEWRSDLKWQRLQPHLTPLHGRRVLDVGCGSGYHLWRMRGDGAALVVGVEPALLYLAQFAAARRYLPGEPVYLLPCRLEDLPAGAEFFDTVFSMGVIYHRRDPLAHLAELSAALRPGGELVLETLIVEDRESLQPGERYAQMRNVFMIPGVELLVRWLRAAGFADIRVPDVTRTTGAEQRATDWMRFQSLADFLDPRDPSRTVEGHPAPVRALAIARKPE